MNMNLEVRGFARMDCYSFFSGKYTIFFDVSNPYTTCTIYKNGSDGKLYPIKVGVSLCSPSDTWDLKTGMKNSLTKTVRGLPRKDREMIWYKFLGEIK